MTKYRKPVQHVRDYPGRGHTIVLLHGFLASKTYWKKLVPILQADGYRVIAIDLLGFGEAPKPKSIEYSYEDHIAHIKSVLDTLDIRTPVSVVGHSMGGLLALRYAIRHEQDIESVCLLHPPMYRNPDEAMQILRDTGRMYRFLLDSNYRHIAWILLRNITPFSAHIRHSREGSLRNVITLAAFFGDLKQLKRPLLLFVGKSDRGIYLDNLSKVELDEHVAVSIEETGHHSPITHAARIGTKINGFIARNKATER